MFLHFSLLFSLPWLPSFAARSLLFQPCALSVSFWKQAGRFATAALLRCNGSLFSRQKQPFCIATAALSAAERAAVESGVTGVKKEKESLIIKVVRDSLFCRTVNSVDKYFFYRLSMNRLWFVVGSFDIIYYFLTSLVFFAIHIILGNDIFDIFVEEK